MEKEPPGGEGRSGSGTGRFFLRSYYPRTLAPRLIVPLTLIVIVVLGTTSFLALNSHRRQLLDEMILGADQLSGTIANSTWHAMLADRREDAYQMIQSIARQPGIEKVRFFNKEGRVMFSTEPEVGTFVDKSAEACYLCHARSQPLVRVDVPSRARIYARTSAASEGRARGKGRILGMVTPIYNEKACSDAECHAHPPGIQVLGVLDVSMSLERIDEEMAEAGLRSFLSTLLTIVLAGVFIGFFVRRVVGRPIRKLMAAADSVSRMQLDRPVALGYEGEIGELARSFEVMRVRLQQAMEELNGFTQRLERKVAERTAQLAATQQTLIQRDRLASLGQLSATMAHEINNPLSGVRNLAALMTRVLSHGGMTEERKGQFLEYLAQIEQETTRVSRIVSDLLSFARQTAPRQGMVDLEAVVRDTLILLRPQLIDASVEVAVDFQGNLPSVPCDRAQVMQVVMNLVRNAAEAMPQGGEIRIRTSRDTNLDTAVLEVTDTGYGIAKEHLVHVFEPFYTTKEEGKGVGLGLAVVYGIVTAHGGECDIRSDRGLGTTVRVSLPLAAVGAPVQPA